MRTGMMIVVFILWLLLHHQLVLRDFRTEALPKSQMAKVFQHSRSLSAPHGGYNRTGTLQSPPHPPGRHNLTSSIQKANKWNLTRLALALHCYGHITVWWTTSRSILLYCCMYNFYIAVSNYSSNVDLHQQSFLCPPTHMHVHVCVFVSPPPQCDLSLLNPFAPLPHTPSHPCSVVCLCWTYSDHSHPSPSVCLLNHR